MFGIPKKLDYSCIFDNSSLPKYDNLYSCIAYFLIEIKSN